MPIDHRAQRGAEDDTAETVEIAPSHRRGQEAVSCAEESHCKISQEEICLRNGHIVLIVRLRGNEVQHCRRTLHPEEASKHTADRPRRDLEREGRTDMDPG